jgi:hypothetical protein
MKYILVFLLMSFSLWAQTVGEVSKLIGTGAKVNRSGDIQVLIEGQTLELGDRVMSNEAIVQLILFPGTQMNLSKNTELIISEHLLESSQSKSIIEFIKGELRVLVKKFQPEEKVEQTYRTGLVDFGVRGTEFILSDSNEASDIEVVEGEVQATERDSNRILGSVKANERFKYLKAKIKERWIRGETGKRFNQLQFKESTFIKEKFLQKRQSFLNQGQGKQSPRVKPSRRFLREQRQGQ